MAALMKASDLAARVNGGTPTTIRYECADGTIRTPTVVRATEQRWGALDLLTFHEAGMPDHIGALSQKPENEIEVVR